MRIIKSIIKKIMIVLLVGIFFFAGFIGYIVVTDYAPEDIEEASIVSNVDATITGTTFSVTTFNIGYGGLDKNQDFFLDGGTMSRSSSKEQTETNLDSFTSFMETVDSDFYLLQEVDVKADRSFDIDQLDFISNYFNYLSSTFSYNFKVKWVPAPLANPIGGVEAGLMNLSRYHVESSTRYQLPTEDVFLKEYFDLDRSIMEDVYTLENGKKLYMVNIHLSAYDKGGTTRAQQIQFLIDYIDELYDNGNNYIIFGGDWNHLLDDSKMTDTLPNWVALLPDELYDTGFKLVYDTNVNTVRSDDTAYVKGTNFETVIDGFLISPNINVESITGHDLGFENSDHNPVTLSFTLE